MKKIKEKLELEPIFSMWLREILRFFTSRGRVISTFVQPFLFLGLLTIPMSRLFHAEGSPQAQAMQQMMFGGTSFYAFLVPGIISMGLLFGGTMGGVSVLWDKEFGFLKEVMVAPVRRTSLMIGRSLGAMTTGIVQALMTTGVGVLFGIWYDFHIKSVGGFFLALLCMILTFATFVGFGLTFGGLFEETEGFMAFLMLIQMPLFFCSGAMVPIKQIKGIPVLYQFCYINPLTYGVDGIRGALTGVYSMNWVVDLLVILGCAILFLVLGAFEFSRMEVS